MPYTTRFIVGRVWHDSTFSLPPAGLFSYSAFYHLRSLDYCGFRVVRIRNSPGVRA